ncbi:MAG: NAD(P)/FAD-dependent oxidoreductase, partial [Mycobacterium sp.]|nr:NAD(P)/FAD-dependent oxidoreductase [Mycobacterium sp.]
TSARDATSGMPAAPPRRYTDLPSAAADSLSASSRDDPATRAPFKYFDKGSMATISRHHAVAKIGKLEFGGYLAWLSWLFLHLVYLVGFKNRISTLLSWTITFTSSSRGQLATTSQWVYARLAMNIVEKQIHDAVSGAERQVAHELDPA